MWQRLRLIDLRVICHYSGSIIIICAFTMFIPFITALLCQEWEPAARYLLSGGITFVVGALLRYCRIEPGRLNRRQALAVTGLSWMVLGFFASIPLYYSGHFLTYADALFDGVSGFTTTGASVIVDLDHLSYADNMFRFVMHLFGGLGLIAIALSIGLFGPQSSGTLFSSEGRSEHVLPNVVQTVQFIFRVVFLGIALATVIMMVLCLLAGIEPLRAFLQGLWLSISGIVTGGFTPMSQSVMYYHSLPIEFVLMILMLMGSLSFALYAEVWKGRLRPFFHDIDNRSMLVWLVIATIIFTASMSAGTLMTDLPDLMRRGLFMVCSAFSTTGFQVVTANQLTTVFTSGAFLVLALVMAIGGAAGSTAGGIKVSRIAIIFKSIISTVKETLAPDSARVATSYNHLGRRTLTPDIVRDSTTVFVLYVFTYGIASLVTIAHGYDATQSIFESVAMASNGGIVTGIVAPGMPLSLELFYIILMWAGRLEFVTLVAIIVQIIVTFVPRRKRKVEQ